MLSDIDIDTDTFPAKIYVDYSDISESFKLSCIRKSHCLDSAYYASKSNNKLIIHKDKL